MALINLTHTYVCVFICKGLWLYYIVSNSFFTYHMHPLFSLYFSPSYILCCFLVQWHSDFLVLPYYFQIYNFCFAMLFPFYGFVSQFPCLLKNVFQILFWISAVTFIHFIKPFYLYLLWNYSHLISLKKKKGIVRGSSLSLMNRK